MRDRLLASSLPREDEPSRDLTDIETMLLHSYGKDQGVLLFPEIDDDDTPRRRRRAESE
jgi:hypothetical protein